MARLPRRGAGMRCAVRRSGRADLAVEPGVGVGGRGPLFSGLLAAARRRRDRFPSFRGSAASPSAVTAPMEAATNTTPPISLGQRRLGLAALASSFSRRAVTSRDAACARRRALRPSLFSSAGVGSIRCAVASSTAETFGATFSCTVCAACSTLGAAHTRASRILSAALSRALFAIGPSCCAIGPSCCAACCARLRAARGGDCLGLLLSRCQRHVNLPDGPVWQASRCGPRQPCPWAVAVRRIMPAPPCSTHSRTANACRCRALGTGQLVGGCEA